MIVIPAIDILDEKVVRLYQGQKALQIIYSSSPYEVAKKWQEEGAELIHIVDLNASFGEGNNLAVIKKIVELKIKVEVGGGIRNIKKAEQVFAIGVDRIIISTGALDDEFLSHLIRKFPGKIGVSVDVLKGKFMKEGWQRVANVKIYDFINYLIEKGVDWIVYTDISRDGTMKGPDTKEINRLVPFKNNVKYIVSGGIAKIEDIKKIKEHLPFVYGVIIGKALYEGKIQLKEAITLFS